MRDRKQHRAYASAYAFGVLGSQARVAIPELSGIMNDRRCSFSTARNAAEALRALDAGPEFVAGLMNRRELAAAFVGGFGGDVPSVLRRLLGDELWSVRNAARAALNRIMVEESQRKSTH